jgi:hypothetical protein
MSTPLTHQIAGGDMDVWVSEGGSICLQVRTAFGDPVELGEQEALALAALLTKLVEEQRE